MRDFQKMSYEYTKKEGATNKSRKDKEKMVQKKK